MPRHTQHLYGAYCVHWRTIPTVGLPKFLATHRLFIAMRLRYTGATLHSNTSFSWSVPCWWKEKGATPLWMRCMEWMTYYVAVLGYECSKCSIEIPVNYDWASINHFNIAGKVSCCFCIRWELSQWNRTREKCSKGLASPYQWSFGNLFVDFFFQPFVLLPSSPQHLLLLRHLYFVYLYHHQSLVCLHTTYRQCKWYTNTAVIHFSTLFNMDLIFSPNFFCLLRSQSLQST